MFCSNCENQLPKDALFCQKCGAKVNGEENRAYQAEKDEISRQNETRKTYIPDKLPYQQILNKLKKIPVNWEVGIVILLIICAYLSFHKPGREVRTSYLEQYSTSVTVEDAFENFFEDAKWKVRKEDGERYVVFTGKCLYLEEKANVKIRFKVKGDRFYVADMEMNGEPQSDFTLLWILSLIYEEY